MAGSRASVSSDSTAPDSRRDLVKERRELIRKRYDELQTKNKIAAQLADKEGRRDDFLCIIDDMNAMKAKEKQQRKAAKDQSTPFNEVIWPVSDDRGTWY